MPARKKPGTKPAEKPAPSRPTREAFAKLCKTVDFPCDESRQIAWDLFKMHDDRFVEMAAKVNGAVPLSLLVKVIGPTLLGRPPVLKASKSFKDRGTTG